MHKKLGAAFERVKTARALAPSSRRASLPSAAALLALGLGVAACRAKSEPIAADDPAPIAPGKAKAPPVETHAATPFVAPAKPAGNEIADVPIAAPKKLVVPAPKPTSTTRPPIQPPDNYPMLGGDISSVRATHPHGGIAIG